MRERLDIMAFDPGGTTGWTHFGIRRNFNEKIPVDFCWSAPPRVADHILGQGQIDEPMHYRALWELLEEREPDIVICERFDNSGNEFAKIVSAEYIGVIKLWCGLHSKMLIMQGADVMTFSVDKIGPLGLKVLPAGWVHMNDSMCHMLYFLANGTRSIFPEIQMYVLREIKRVMQTGIK